MERVLNFFGFGKKRDPDPGALVGSAMQLRQADELICILLRGEPLSWPSGPPGLIEAFLERSRYHGADVLLNERIAAVRNAPPAVVGELRRRSIAEASWEMRDSQVLSHVFDALAQQGVRALLFKGASLAYSTYPNSSSRMRSDADVVVESEARPLAGQCLASLGFVADLIAAEDFASYQRSYVLTTAGGGAHVIDLHWKINNSALLARRFEFDELAARSTPLPRLGAKATGVGTADALLLACMHRMTHEKNPYYVDGEAHYGGDRLIWLYDIHLLARSFSDHDWRLFTRLAREKGLCATCLDGLRQAQACFHSDYPDFALAALREGGSNEAITRYFRRGHLGQFFMDFAALDSPTVQMAYLRELVCPPGHYMREKYPDARFGWLPWLYLRRGASGAAHWLFLHRKRA
jgi:hypothetical protein